MAEKFDFLNEKHGEFIRNQHLFFVATAAADGLVNLSPKGMDSFRIIDNANVAWLNLTGSGNETAAHLRDNNRMTIMFCSFEKQPLILRIYGRATAVHPRDSAWSALYARFAKHPGARQIFTVKLDLVQTSCGYAVPAFEFKGERPTLTKWAENHGQAGIEKYWQEKNQLSLDGKHTGIINAGDE